MICKYTHRNTEKNENKQTNKQTKLETDRNLRKKKVEVQSLVSVNCTSIMFYTAESIKYDFNGNINPLYAINLFCIP